MSQDLFAAFGEEDSRAVWSDQSNIQKRSFTQDNELFNVWSGVQTTNIDHDKDAGTATAVEDEDDFGDFEDASAASASGGSAVRQRNETEFKSELKSTQITIASKTSLSKASSKTAKDAQPSTVSSSKKQDVGNHPFAGRMDLLFEAGDDEYDAGEDELADLATNPEAAMAYSKRIIAEQEAAQLRLRNTSMPEDDPAGPTVVEAKGGQLESEDAKSLPSRPSAKDPNVLFDADDLSEEEEADDEDDDFDDFEDGKEPFEPANKAVDETNNQHQSNTTAMDLLGLDETWQGAGEISKERSLNGQPSIAVASDDHAWSKEEQEFWDDFETSAPAKVISSPKVVTSPLPSSASKNQSKKAALNEQDTLPPTNVPPPAVLLAIFTSVFAEADEALFNTIAKLDLKQKQMLLAHPASHQFLKRYLGHCTALARIIAGRKHRWKRDQRLSQSMRIGPAAAGGKGGMKLTGLDKSEVAKEDREVVDVLRLWKGQVGKLRTAVAAASAAPAVPKLPSVPEIAEQMSVKTLRSVEGGLTAPQPCALCGLKREERVSKVDVEVDDSFGEWWVQGMNMHLACRDFWDEFERKLKSR